MYMYVRIYVGFLLRFINLNEVLALLTDITSGLNPQRTLLRTNIFPLFLICHVCLTYVLFITILVTDIVVVVVVVIVILLLLVDPSRPTFITLTRGVPLPIELVATTENM